MHNAEDSDDVSLVAAKLKRALYKYENGDIDQAENLFEELVFTHDAPEAYGFLGIIKLDRFGDGKTTIRQAIDCFKKAVEAAPTLKSDIQEKYCEKSIERIDAFHQFYENAVAERGNAKNRAWTSLALAGLGLAVSNHGKKTGTKILGGTSTVYGTVSAGTNFSRVKDIKKLMEIYENHIKELAEGVRSFCSDNVRVYQSFIDGMNQRGLNDVLGIRQIETVNQKSSSEGIPTKWL